MNKLNNLYDKKIKALKLLSVDSNKSKLFQFKFKRRFKHFILVIKDITAFDEFIAYLYAPNQYSKIDRAFYHMVIRVKIKMRFISKYKQINEKALFVRYNNLLFILSVLIFFISVYLFYF